jgi:rhamnosyltransferase
MGGDRLLVQDKMSVGVCVITYKAKHHLPKCLPPLLNSPLKPKVVVVNSSSKDGTVELAEAMGAQTLVMPRDQFNHGLTREEARKFIGTDVVCMMTPDAYFQDRYGLEKLVEPIVKNQASIAYAKQLPHEGAGFFESFAREFNYPEKSHIRGVNDLDKWGVYTYFCSNSCSAWSNRALDQVGGFPHVLLGEDTIACAKLLNLGHLVAYVAEAKVHHSHSYSLKQEFQRHFDTGLARGEIQSLIGTGDSARGKTFAFSLLKKVAVEKPKLLPYSFFHLGAKWSGYKLGQKMQGAPTSLKKFFSSQDFYWK